MIVRKYISEKLGVDESAVTDKTVIPRDIDLRPMLVRASFGGASFYGARFVPCSSLKIRTIADFLEVCQFPN